MIYYLTTFFTNHNIQPYSFFSALSGLIGTVLIFFYGVPRQIDTGGYGRLIVNGPDQKEMKKIKCYKRRSFLGLLFIFLSFLLTLIGLF